MILVAGIGSEPPVARAVAAADARGAPYILFDQRRYRHAKLVLGNDTGHVSGHLDIDGERHDLSRLTGIYLRLMDDHMLPGVRDLAADDPERQRARALHDAFYCLAEVAPCRVANRPRHMLSNQSKPYQADIIRRHGFRIPETLVTNDPEAAYAFWQSCRTDGDDVIYKSLSGVRSIVETVDAADIDRLGRLAACPVQFQRRVRGTDIRVHVVGSATFAAEIDSTATDYRYASRQVDAAAELAVAELPPRVAAAAVRLADTLLLPFSGIDLRRTPDGDWYCFEVNPSPAYSYYESHTGLPIADALVRYLGAEMV